jgi:chromate reductase
VLVLGIAGSLRKGSFNRALLAAARELLPAGMELRTFDAVGELPLFNADLEAAGAPAAALALKRAIAEADALLIATPEYNGSIPGVLKNAIDWASRPPERVFSGKPTALMGATPGPRGTLRAQLALRQSLQTLDVPIMPRPELYLDRAAEKFAPDGKLIHEPTRKLLRQLLEGLVTWTNHFGNGR